MVILDKEEFQRWRDHPLTKEFLTLLGNRQRDLMEAWGRGHSLTPEQQAGAVLLGQLAGLSFEYVCDLAGIERPEEPVG